MHYVNIAIKYRFMTKIFNFSLNIFLYKKYFKHAKNEFFMLKIPKYIALAFYDPKTLQNQFFNPNCYSVQHYLLLDLF